ncbi:hypothetical protein vB_AbaP_Acibel007_8 [Acinetobacter phage vB_AbaP_Acibel007]|uniref:Uncharacterized protein n=1 Tax=Acinetobacter phage vB_AbaP_Acibel007 TaxID=1481187 RepID=A0A075DXA5_9CAUD|nr:hypothetical protein vB_AbaP_Acibel007_8 [Acinetobacter phage vB_AbaP_Acibel007]AHY26779.1 hypothetical protein vB_AbaP_Acibel007_8 [Acinetobacter phage vB_AbaP_Acibel007]
MLHPSLNTYTTLKVDSPLSRKSTKFLVSPEFGSTELLPLVAEVLKGFTPYTNGLGYYWEEDEVAMEYLGSGCFSSVFKHPNRTDRAIKLFRNYREDSTCYQYLRLCANKTIDYEWCPTVHSLGRIKVISYNSKQGHWETRDCAYAELDLLPYNCNDSAVYMDDWYAEFRDDVKDVYFPFGDMDLKPDNVLGKVNDEGICQYFITDPIWNSEPEHYEPIPEPLKELYVYPKTNGTFINNLRESIKHGRVW